MIQSAASAIQSNPLAKQADSGGLPTRVINAIKNAANQTGVDFTYLMQKASQESSFDANAKASSSSATGLYQFTQQTWLQMVKNYGGKYGLGTYADHISMDSNGVAHVKDPTWRQAILNLRKDPQASAEMAGELDKENLASLQDNVDGKIGGTELYLAHFLGAGGASKFLNDMQDDPKQVAADVLPTAAAANPSVFYAKDGTPRSLQQIYQHFAKKFDGTANITMMASNTTTPTASTSSEHALVSNPVMASLTTSPVSAAIFSGMSANVASPISATASALKSEGSSLFATMVLAQMNVESSATAAASGIASASNHNGKKNPYDLMGMALVG